MHQLPDVVSFRAVIHLFIFTRIDTATDRRLVSSGGKYLGMILKSKLQYIRHVHLQTLEAILDGTKTLNIFEKNKDIRGMNPIERQGMCKCERKREDNL